MEPSIWSTKLGIQKEIRNGYAYFILNVLNINTIAHIITTSERY